MKIAFSTWRKIKIGFLTSVEFLRYTLQDSGFSIGENANQIMDKIKVSKNGSIVELELVVVTQADLGFADGTTFESMTIRAKEFGIEKCPAELGPYLRLDYKDQQGGEGLRIAMEPIIASGGYLCVFYISCSGGELWLYTDWFRPQYIFNPDISWVFTRSRK